MVVPSLSRLQPTLPTSALVHEGLGDGRGVSTKGLGSFQQMEAEICRAILGIQNLWIEWLHGW